MDAPEPALPPKTAEMTYADKAKAGWASRPLVAYSCLHCGKSRETKVPHLAKYCSNSCNWAAQRDKGTYDREIACNRCGTKFVASPNSGKRYRQTCSVDCRKIITAQTNSRMEPQRIREAFALEKAGKSQRAIAKQLGCSQSAVNKLLKGNSHRWLLEQMDAAAQTPEPAILPEAPQGT